MDCPIDVSAAGAVSLGPDIVCDGFLRDARARVQTHVHIDHLSGFESSKGFQEILLSPATLALLIAEHDADLPYRSNILALEEHAPHRVATSEVTLVPSNHMLGAVQVQVELEGGLRVGYSGDFNWPVDTVIEVDCLVVDCTSGSPANIRNFTQGECEAQLVHLLERSLTRGQVHLKAHRGTLQRALCLIAAEIDCPIVGSVGILKEAEVYRNFGYAIGDLASTDTEEGRQLLHEPRVIRIYGLRDKLPASISDGIVISLSAYFTRPDSPIVEYSERRFGVALSDHADFNGTLEYIKNTGAHLVITDNSRHGKGYNLALEITRRLGIEARPSSNHDTKEWGR